jgi:predicted DNA-binding transcriptional regulator AlpA
MKPTEPLRSSPLLNEREVADLIGMSIYWLQKARLNGTGPAFLKIGRSVRYRTGALDLWLAQREPFDSMTEGDNR